MIRTFKLLSCSIFPSYKLGLQRMMEIASEMEEIQYESSMEITENTSPNVAVVLGKIFDNMYYDLARERFTTKIEEFIQ